MSSQASDAESALDAAIGRFETAHPTLEGWRDSFFSSIAPNDRVRSGSDAARLIVSALASVVIVLAYRTNPSIERWWVRLAVPPPTGIAWLLTTLFLAGTIGAAVLLAFFALLVRRRDLSLDLAVGFGVGLAVSYALQFFLGVSAGRATTNLLRHINIGFPVPLLVAVVSMVIVGRPYFARGVRRFIVVVVAVSVIGAITTGRALPLALAGSLLIGWSCASIVHLWFGRPRVAASIDALASAARVMGISVAAVTDKPADPIRASQPVAEWGVERAYVTDTAGVVNRISVYGRDTRDAETLSSLWRVITVRDSGVTPFLGRQQQAEHEALAIATIFEATSGASPKLEGLTETAVTHDALVVATGPAGVTLRELRQKGPLTDEQLRSIVQLVATIHAARVALGTIDLDHLAMDESGRAVIDDTLHAVLNASERERHQDVACLMALLGLAGDVDRAVSTVKDVLGVDVLVAALAFLEKPALNATLRREMKDNHDLLEQLRKAGAKAAGIDEPKLAPFKRVSGTALMLGLGTIVGGWALLGVFVNVASSINTLTGANWGWVALTCALSLASFVTLGVADLGSITGKLPVARLTALEVANSFAGLAVGAVTVVATRVRFLQRQGYDATAALSSSVLVSLASWIIKGVLLAVALPFAWHKLHFARSPIGGGGHGHLIKDVLVIVIALTVAAAVAFAVPKWRSTVKAKLMPKFHEIRSLLKTLATQPRKLAEIFGGTILAQLLVAYTLGTALHAFGTHLPISTLIVVLTLGSVLGGISPVPGGVGVVEAGMILGLSAAGVSQPIAVAAVFVQRLFTAYLPPMYGYVTLLWLRRHEYL